MDCGALRLAGRAAGTTGATAAMNCGPAELASLSRCYCFGSKWRSVLAYIYCQWANNLTPPVVPFYFALDGALQLWIDTNGTHNAGDYTLAQFQAIADYPSVTRFSFVGLIHTTSILGLQDFPLLNRINVGISHLPVLDCSGLNNLQIVGLTTPVPHAELVSLILDGCSALYFIWVPLQSLTSVDISDCPLLNNVNFSGNLLTQAAVDAILHQIVLNGLTGGALNLGGVGNAAPSAAGLADKAILEALVPPWTVTTN